MKSKLFFALIVVLVGILFLSGCANDPNHEFIQGQWLFANEHGDSLSGSGHLYYEWRFDNGYFSMYREILLGMPSTLYGYYRILYSDEDSITLQIYDLDGTEASQYTDRVGELTLTIHREDDTLDIGRTLFYRAFTDPGN
jgi:hypothetical protein